MGSVSQEPLNRFKEPFTRLRPGTAQERQVVLRQLDRILCSPLLNQSQRYSRLLRYLVEKALSNDEAPPKERIVGAEVFGRDPGYDTTHDPVVRTTTAQLRRRLAHYYEDAAAEEAKILIDLPLGGYAVEFYLAETSLPLETEHALERQPGGPISSGALFSAPAAPFQHRRGLIMAASVVLLSVSSFGLYRGTVGRSAHARFWDPVLSSPEPTLISLGRPSTSSRPAGADNSPPVENPTVRQYWKANTPDWPPVMLTSIVAMLKANGHDYHISKADTTTPADFERSSVILIGALNNRWTMKLNDSLRFSYGTDHNGKAWIEDRENPASRAWAIDFNAPFSSLREDYGIIARFTDPATKKIVVLASGIVGYGTKGAGDFLTKEQYMEAFAAQAPRGWERRNLEIVFATPVIDGKAGPPRILATHLW
jgi:hypothetical protein